MAAARRIDPRGDVRRRAADKVKPSRERQPTTCSSGSTWPAPPFARQRGRQITLDAGDAMAVDLHERMFCCIYWLSRIALLATGAGGLGAGAAQRLRSLYDRFRGRIMFPLRRRPRPGARIRRSRHVGGARSEGLPEQLRRAGSTERAASSSVSTSRARTQPESGRIVVVEGYTDVLAMHQAGSGEAGTIMGTALTEEQVGELAKMAKRVIRSRRRPGATRPC